MTYEYECPGCKQRFEKFFRSFSAAEEHEFITECENCTGLQELPNGGHVLVIVFARRVPSVPLAAHLYGDPQGYHKPSPTKRFTTKTVSRKEGNNSAIG